MAQSRDAQSSVSPRVQAIRQEQAAKGEFLARSFRNRDLVQAGVSPESLVLIGGRSAVSLEGGAAVALWLVEMGHKAGLTPAAIKLYTAMVREKAPEQGKYFYSTAYRASLSLARMLAQVSIEQMEKEGETVNEFPPMQSAEILGEWWASMVEGAGQSETMATVYELHKNKTEPDEIEPTELIKAVNQAANIGDDETQTQEAEQ